MQMSDAPVFLIPFLSMDTAVIRNEPRMNNGVLISHCDFEYFFHSRDLGLSSLKWGHNLYPVFLLCGVYWESPLKMQDGPQRDTFPPCCGSVLLLWVLPPLGVLEESDGWPSGALHLYPVALFHTGPPCLIIRLWLIKVL